MKKYLLLLILPLITFGFLNCSNAQAQLLQENFSYTTGTLLTANGWTSHSGAGTNSITVTAPTISYTNYLSSGIGNEVSMVATGEDVNSTFPAQTSGTVYAGFLVNVTAATTGGDYFFHLGPNTIGSTFRGRVFVKRDASSALSFGISYGGAAITYTPFSYALNTTYLVVVKYTIVAGASNDFVDMFINPVLGAPEPTPTVTATDVTTDPGDIGSVALRQGGSTTGPTLKLDGIRVGLTWADVTASGTIIAPTTQTSNFTFSDILQNQMNVAWSPGNGTKRVVKINTVNSFTAPTDGLDPTANATYGGTGEQVVYNGSGSTAPIVSGLLSNTQYWFQAWEYNGTGALTKYCTVSGANNPLNQTTAASAAPPVITTPTSASITASGATLGGNITADGGAPILERGTVWKASPGVSITDNKLAEGGTTTGVFTHIRSGMPANTPIYYAAYATNSAGTSLSGESSFTTLLGEPTNHAASFTAISPNYSSIVNTWLDNDGAQPATGFMILANTTGTFTDPVDGVQPASDSNLGDGSGLVYVNHGVQTYTWTGLISSTPYYFAIYAYTNFGANIDYKILPAAPTANVTTLAFVPPVAAWTFDATAPAPDTPTSVSANFGNQSGTAMLYADGTNVSSLWVTTVSGNELTTFGGTTLNDPREGGAILAGNAYTAVGGTGFSSNGKSMVFKFSMSALQNAVVSFAIRGTSTGFNVHQWAWSINGTSFTDFGPNTADNSANFVLKTLDLSAISQINGAPIVYLRLTFSGASNVSGNNRLDNIVIRASAATTLPPSVETTAATAVEATTATLNGTVNANNQSTTVIFEYGLDVSYGMTVAGVPPTVTGGTTTAVSANLTGLQQNKTYYFRIKGTNVNGTSNGNGLFFVTGCLPTGDAGQITGPSTVIADGATQYQYSVPVIANATNYIWSFPLPSTIVAGNGTNMVTVTFSPGAVSGNASVFGVNACDVEGGSSQYAITVSAVPVNLTVTGTVSPGPPVCYNATNTITVAGGVTTFVVLNGGSATMIAGQKISYLPGTTVFSGGYLWGKITTSGQYCTPAKSTTVLDAKEETGVRLMENAFKIYPNPTSGVFTIEQLSDLTTNQVKVGVLGMLGGKILSTDWQGTSKKTISIKGNPPGIYFVTVTTGNKVQTVKIILTN
ncbi:MAG: T9SS type A sorting domain-containing protein [Bacteroidales bacterium]|nr:T9SS type A sorting domain-containing protein [Bacteroidales bacterium]